MYIQPLFFGHPITAIPSHCIRIIISMARHIISLRILYIFVAMGWNNCLEESKALFLWLAVLEVARNPIKKKVNHRHRFKIV